MTKIFIVFFYFLVDYFVLKRYTFSEYFSFLFELNLWFKSHVGSVEVGGSGLCIFCRCSFFVGLHLYISLYILDIEVGGADVCDLLEAVEGLMAIVEEIYDFRIGLFVEKFHFEFIDLSALVEV